MFKKAYQPHARVQSVIDPKSGLTQQSFAEECDINHIVEVWTKTGQIPVYHRQPFYGDFSEVPDPQEAASLIAYAEQHFAQLPVEEQERFGDALTYFEAVLASEDEGGHNSSLDVIVPTDTNSAGKEVKDGNASQAVTSEESKALSS